MKSRARQQPAAKASPGRTAVMYVRVSSKEQEQGFSIAAQRQLLTDYAEREGIHVLQEFEDIETAKRAGRTAFGEMVAFLSEKGSACRTLLVEKAVAAGLTNRTGGGALARSRIHQVLQNPIYYGEFYWLGQLHQGVHKPVISRDLYDRVQAVFTAANHPRHTKRRHALAGLVTCGRCGCAFTGEIKKGQYVYYHCTGHRGRCGNPYVPEEELIPQFGELLKQIRIPTELAGKLATVLRESQTDKEKFVRTSMLRLQQQQMLLRSKLDRVYEDRLSDAIPEELWNSKSAALQDELGQVRTEIERHAVASQPYATAGAQIL